MKKYIKLIAILALVLVPCFAKAEATEQQKQCAEDCVMTYGSMNISCDYCYK